MGNYYRLESPLLLLRHAGTPPYREAPLDTVATRRPAGPRTSTHARINQLYGRIPVVSSVYEACQPDRRVNTTEPPSSFPSTEPITRPTFTSKNSTKREYKSR
jgi:hypothetical protein